MPGRAHFPGRKRTPAGRRARGMGDGRDATGYKIGHWRMLLCSLKLQAPVDDPMIPKRQQTEKDA